MFFVQEPSAGVIQLWYSPSANQIAVNGFGSLLDDAKYVANFSSKKYALAIANTMNKVSEIHQFIASLKKPPAEDVGIDVPTTGGDYYAS